MKTVLKMSVFAIMAVVVFGGLSLHGAQARSAKCYSVAVDPAHPEIRIGYCTTNRN